MSYYVICCDAMPCDVISSDVMYCDATSIVVFFCGKCTKKAAVSVGEQPDYHLNFKVASLILLACA